MKKILCICCVVASSLYAQTNEILNIEGFKSPQALRATKSHIFVSNAGENHYFTKNGSGFISKLDKTGKIIDSQFISNLNAPHGMTIIDNTLYIVDIDTLKSFNLDTKKQVLNFPISGVNTLSDVAAKDNNILLVGDRESGLVLLVDLKKKNYYTFVTIENTFGALNSIALDEHFLYVSTFDSENNRGFLLKVNIETKEVKVINEFAEKLGGIVITEGGGIIVGGFGHENKGKLYKITTQGKIYEIDLDEELQGPMMLAIDEQTIWIPHSLGNKIQKITPNKQ